MITRPEPGYYWFRHEGDDTLRICQLTETNELWLFGSEYAIDWTEDFQLIEKVKPMTTSSKVPIDDETGRPLIRHG